MLNNNIKYEKETRGVLFQFLIDKNICTNIILVTNVFDIDMKEFVTHHICYIPEIIIAVPGEWLSKLNKTGNAENTEKREALLQAVKRWIYLSWVLQSNESNDIQKAYQQGWMWDEIAWIKDKCIPEIVFPHKVVYITSELTLETGRMIQLSGNRRPVELDFSEEQPQRPRYSIGVKAPLNDFEPRLSRDRVWK